MRSTNPRDTPTAKPVPLNTLPHCGETAPFLPGSRSGPAAGSAADGGH